MYNKNVSRIGFGGARLGSLSNPLSMRDCTRLLEVAKDIGITFFDTANIYGQGDSERLIGKAVRENRSGFAIATKAGKRFSRKMRLIRPLKPLVRLLPRSAPATRQAVIDQRARNIGTDFNAGRLELDLQDSLRRLKTDYVDFFMLHSPSVSDLADTSLFEALERIRDKGMAARVGVSCDSAEVALAALEGRCISALQLPVHEFRKIESNLTSRPDVFVVLRGIVRARGDRSVRQAYADTIANPVVGTALVDTTSATRLRELDGLV